MKFLQIISNLNIKSGGPSISTWFLVKGLRNSGLDTRIVTYQPKSFHDKMIGKEDFVYTLPSPIETRYAYSKLFKEFLQSNSYNLYHGHGLWQYPVYAMAKLARQLHKPYLISPRGMLHPEALKNSVLLKKIALLLFQYRDLKNAAVLHATSMQEVQFIRAMKLNNPVALIPNAINIALPEMNIEKPVLKRVGFLGRFAPIKNIEILLEAFVRVQHHYHDIELVLIGDGSVGYRNQLERLAQQLGIKNILFTGFLAGEQRENVLRSLSLLVLPSKSENFGMVVPEALLREIPVITTKGTPWEELETHNCGWWVDIGVEPLKVALEQALTLPQESMHQMGKNGRKLVEEKYSIEVVAEQMIRLYKWILKEGEKPEFVFD